MTFAIIAPAIITGAFAGRIKFSAMIVFSIVWTLLVYAPVVHWIWGGGFLDKLGVLDFAGGTVVHINAGVAGLVAAVVIGRGVKTAQLPNNLPLSVIGASLLWVGWFGFNGGSALAANAQAGMAILSTQVAAAAGVLSWMTVEWIRRGKPSLQGNISGAVSGLVAITPACGYVGPVSAFVIGALGGLACYWACTSLKRLGNYDDSLDAFGIHGLGGIVGALLTGVFAVETIGGVPGLLEGNARQVMVQAIGVFATICYCAAVTFLILKIIQKTIGLRVDIDTEVEGLDIKLHGERAEEP
jgi:Amt family ammonium transporter